MVTLNTANRPEVRWQRSPRLYLPLKSPERCYALRCDNDRRAYFAQVRGEDGQSLRANPSETKFCELTFELITMCGTCVWVQIAFSMRICELRERKNRVSIVRVQSTLCCALM